MNSTQVVGPKLDDNNPSSLNMELFAKKDPTLNSYAMDDNNDPEQKARTIATPLRKQDVNNGRYHINSSINSPTPLMRKEKKIKEDHKRSSHTSMIKVLARLKDKIRDIRIRIGYGKIENLKQRQFDILCDSAYFSNRNYENSMSQRTISSTKIVGESLRKFLMIIEYAGHSLIARKLKELLFKINNFKAIKPTSSFKLIWSILMMILIIVFFFILTIHLSFDEKPESVLLIVLFKKLGEDDVYQFYRGLLYFASVAFTIDILISFNTAFYEKGSVILSRRKSARNYLRHQFVYDVLGITPIFFQTLYNPEQVQSLDWINCLFFLKLVDLRRTLQNIENLIRLNDFYESILSLIFLVSQIVFMAHCLSCIWHKISYKNTDYPQTWLTAKNFDSKPWISRYIYSMYWSLSTMITVGYGDITPQNELETGVCMLSMMIGCAIFGYSINNIGNIFQKINQSETELREFIKIMDKYMKSKNIEFDLQGRIRKYLEYIWTEEKSSQSEKEDELLAKLSGNLREEILLHSYGEIFYMTPLFQKNFSAKTIRKLVQIIKTIRFTPGEVIFKEGDIVNQDLFWLVKGEIDLCVGDADQIKLKNLAVNCIFGEISFISGLSREMTAKGINYGTLYCIRKSDFLRILEENREDYEVFCAMRDNILLYNHYEETYSKCLSCERASHTFRGCPGINYIPPNEIIIKKYIFSPFQNRRRNHKAGSQSQHTFKKKTLFSLDKQTDERIKELFKEYDYESEYGTTYRDEDEDVDDLDPAVQYEVSDNMEQQPIEQGFPNYSDVALGEIPEVLNERPSYEVSSEKTPPVIVTPIPINMNGESTIKFSFANSPDISSPMTGGFGLVEQRTSPSHAALKPSGFSIFAQRVSNSPGTGTEDSFEEQVLKCDNESKHLSSLISSNTGNIPNNGLPKEKSATQLPLFKKRSSVRTGTITSDASPKSYMSMNKRRIRDNLSRESFDQPIDYKKAAGRSRRRDVIQKEDEISDPRIDFSKKPQRSKQPRDFRDTSFDSPMTDRTKNSIKTGKSLHKGITNVVNPLLEREKDKLIMLFNKEYDIGKNLSKYFVHNNMENVVKQVTRWRKQRIMSARLPTGRVSTKNVTFTHK